jgi:NAD(P)H-hydrate epimerase
VLVVDATDAPEVLPPSDLVIDAAYGTGFRGVWDPPAPAGAPVLAVDIPSGVDGLTGEAAEGVLPAVRTVTFAALKPGLLLGRGRELAGEVELVDIGLDVGDPPAHLVEDADVAAWLPERPTESHKWKSAVWVVAGSPGMTGAAALCTRAAQRGGAGYVRLSTPGGEPGSGTLPTEAVGTRLPEHGWAAGVLDGVDRFAAVVVGPGLGPGHEADIRELAERCPVPLLVDGDGLVTGLPKRPSIVLTPHDGEYARLAGHPPTADRLAAARELSGPTVLLKGSTTVVAGPDGHCLLTTTGDARLATAGTGDVLSGLIGALLAAGLAPERAAAAGAFLHGRAGRLGPAWGLVAGDLPDLLPAAVRSLP